MTGIVAWDRKIEPEPNSGCWLWTGARHCAGYGYVYRHIARGLRRMLYAHRVIYEHLRGPIAPGLTLDHLCRVRSCVNPAHLEPVPLAENLRRGAGASGVLYQPATHCTRGHAIAEAGRGSGNGQCRTCRRELAQEQALEQQVRHTFRAVGIAFVALIVLLWAPTVRAQAPYPPSQWHPYLGSTNCIQVADSQGNFSCSPLATINPATGVLTLGGPAGVAVTTYLGPVAIVPSGTTIQNALGTDFILSTSPTTVFPVGPGIAGATIRIRQSPTRPGYCRAVMAFGNGVGEYPLAFVNPVYPALGAPVTLFNSPISTLVDYVMFDVPGGSNGC